MACCCLYKLIKRVFWPEVAVSYTMAVQKCWCLLAETSHRDSGASSSGVAPRPTTTTDRTAINDGQSLGPEPFVETVSHIPALVRALYTSSVIDQRKGARLNRESRKNRDRNQLHHEDCATFTFVPSETTTTMLAAMSFASAAAWELLLVPFE